MTILFCSYVFGSEWQDIKYFQRVEEALEMMTNDYKKADAGWIQEFQPFIVTYFSENNEIKDKDIWKVRVSNDKSYDNGGLKTKDGNNFNIYCVSAEKEWGH